MSLRATAFQPHSARSDSRDRRTGRACRRGDASTRRCAPCQRHPYRADRRRRPCPVAHRRAAPNRRHGPCRALPGVRVAPEVTVNQQTGFPSRPNDRHRRTAANNSDDRRRRRDHRDRSPGIFSDHRFQLLLSDHRQSQDRRDAARRRRRDDRARGPVPRRVVGNDLEASVSRRCSGASARFSGTNSGRIRGTKSSSSSRRGYSSRSYEPNPNALSRTRSLRRPSNSP